MSKKGFLWEATVHYSPGELESMLDKGEILTVKVPDNAFDIGGILSMDGGQNNKLRVSMFVTHISLEQGPETFKRTIHFDPAKAMVQDGTMMWSPTEIREMA